MQKAPLLSYRQFIAVAVGVSLWLPSVGAQDTFSQDISVAKTPNAAANWWPAQTQPKALALLQCPPNSLSSDMLAHLWLDWRPRASMKAGGDELVWIQTTNVDEADWLARLRQRQPQLLLRGTFDLWDLVDRYAKQGVIKGYILYRSDSSQGDNNAHRPSMDCSVNVATSLAGLLDGIIVDESLESIARAHGLKLLQDVRNKSQAWCFDTYRGQFNSRVLCTQDPRKPNVRDLAIAQHALTVFGDDALMPRILKWLEPLSVILGWNGGDEFKTTELSSAWGQIQTATDWCLNLPVLMAGTINANLAEAKNLDPRTINWQDTRSAVSFVSTDGDNVQWFEGSFFRGSESASYWGSPERGRIPFGWSCCFSQLAQLCPEAIDYATSTQLPNDEFIEWGGGYYYPDRFAANRPNRWELLAQHAQRTWSQMEKCHTRIIGFDVTQFDSADARKAYAVIAAQTDNLLGILIFQYSAYESGAGQIFWVKDRLGIEVPVITARYSIWEHSNTRPRAGTPAKIAREIRQTVASTPPAQLPRYDWVIIHVWSWFQHIPGVDENAENMPQADAAAHGGLRGYAPALWCAERLPPDIRTVSTGELLWRLRMQHNPVQTQQLIQHWSP